MYFCLIKKANKAVAKRWEAAIAKREQEQKLWYMCYNTTIKRKNTWVQVINATFKEKD